MPINRATAIVDNTNEDDLTNKDNDFMDEFLSQADLYRQPRQSTRAAVQSSVLAKKRQFSEITNDNRGEGSSCQYSHSGFDGPQA